jgi:hypothetical protein
LVSMASARVSSPTCFSKLSTRLSTVVRSFIPWLRTVAPVSAAAAAGGSQDSRKGAHERVIGAAMG